MATSVSVAFAAETGDEVVADAFRLLARETALLWELDAFQPGPGSAELGRVHDRQPSLENASRAELLDELVAVDDELAALKPTLLTRDLPEISFAALQELAPAELRTLIDGRTRFLTPAPYTAALATLSGFRDQTVEEAMADLVEGSERGGPPWIPITATVVASAAGGAGAVTLIRRRHRDDGTAGAVLEVSRLLGDAEDEATVARIVAEGATSLTHAERGWLLRRSPDGLRVAGGPTFVVGSVLERTVATGQPHLGVGDDPLTAGRRCALAAVPVVTRGEVIGVVAVGRNADQPFDHHARTALELLAPVLGTTLTNLDRLDDANSQAMVDGLTAVANRRRLDDDLPVNLATAVQGGLPLGFAMVDVDHFKHFNDTNGHEAGDEALRAVARTIEATVRGSDVVYRYGGEEFCVLLPGATHEDAAAAAERIRGAVEAAEIAGEAAQPGGRLTVSVGVATLDTGDAGSLTRRADEALYEAKANGRNRSVIM